jgi:hypothetical protein
MDVAKLARGLALNRISFGAGLILAPRLYARSWIGREGAATIAPSSSPGRSARATWFSAQAA